MKRTVSINLGGVVFQIDDDAYSRLEKYLSSMEQSFTDEVERKEIMQDIEARIAELFQQRMGTMRNVVNMDDVSFAIDKLGMPEDIEEEIFEDGASRNQQAKNNGKRLYRDDDNKVVGGVCSGISAYFGIDDPIWVRLIFVIGFFLSFSVTFWVYIILLILIPKAKTPSEKLQMRGEPVTASNIEKTVKEEYQSFKSKVGGSGSGSNRGRFQETVNDGSKALRTIAGVILAIIGGLGLAGFLGWTSIGFFAGDNSFYDLFGLVTAGPTNQLLMTIGVFLVAGLPLLWILLVGLKFLLYKRVRLMIPMIAIGVLWILGIILTSVAGAGIGTQYINDGLTRTEEPIDIAPGQDTILINVLTLEDYEEMYASAEGFSFMASETPLLLNDMIVMETVDLRIEPSNRTRSVIRTTKESQGPDRNTATNNARNIQHFHRFENNILTIDNFIQFPKEDKIRVQTVDITLSLVPGTYIKLPANMHYSLGTRISTLDVDYDRIWDDRAHLWVMTNRGLACADCGRDLSAYLPVTVNDSTGNPSDSTLISP